MAHVLLNFALVLLGFTSGCFVSYLSRTMNADFNLKLPPLVPLCPSQQNTSSWKLVGDIPQRPSFFDIAKKHGTDKVSTTTFGAGGGIHRYEIIYEHYLAPLRDKKVKFLEIGLGCNMDYGPGASYRIWLEYFTNVELYFIDYDEACVNKFKELYNRAIYYTGSQDNETMLNTLIRETGGNFDVIVDDGSHHPDHMVTSFKVLFPALKPMGIYVIEDMNSNYHADHWPGTPGRAGYLLNTTMVEYTKSFIDSMYGFDVHEVGKLIRSVHCYYEACVYEKKVAHPWANGYDARISQPICIPMRTSTQIRNRRVKNYIRDKAAQVQFPPYRAHRTDNGEFWAEAGQWRFCKDFPTKVVYFSEPSSRLV